MSILGNRVQRREDPALLTPAVLNAGVDALSHLGVRHVGLPASPERVWAAIEVAYQNRGAAEGGEVIR
ncbi:hypothetical protein BH24ACT3_BH24ACT3_09230 [soil metagenome]